MFSLSSRLAALACALLITTAAAEVRAQDLPDEPYEAAQEASHTAVSPEALQKAKADVDSLRAMPQDKRVDYLIKKREESSPATYEARKAEREARHAYISSLPEKERQSLKEQMKSDRAIVREKMKAKWDAMTPAEKDAAKAKRKAEFDALPEDVKADIKHKREKMKEHRAERRHDTREKH